MVPSPRLIGLTAAWTAASVSIVLFPSLWLLAAASFAGLAAAAIWDWLVVRGSPVRVRRELPERAHVGRSSEVALIISSSARYRLRADVLEQVPADLTADEPSFHEVDLRPG